MMRCTESAIQIQTNAFDRLRRKLAMYATEMMLNEPAGKMAKAGLAGPGRMETNPKIRANPRHGEAQGAQATWA